MISRPIEHIEFVDTHPVYVLVQTDDFANIGWNYDRHILITQFGWRVGYGHDDRLSFFRGVQNKRTRPVFSAVGQTLDVIFMP